MIPNQQDISDACLGLPLGQALSLCHQQGIEPHILYTGERAQAPHLTARVIAVREQTLVVSLFYDGDPRLPEENA